MSQSFPLPDYLRDALIRDGCAQEPLYHGRSFIRQNGIVGETWVLVFETFIALYDILDPPGPPDPPHAVLQRLANRIVRMFPRRLPRPENPPMPAVVSLLEKIDKVKLEKISVEKTVAGGLLEGRCDGADRVICRFTASSMVAFQELAARFNGEIAGNDSPSVKRPPADEPQRGTCARCGKPVADGEGRVCKKCRNKKALFLRVLAYVPRYRLPLILILASMAAGSLLGLLSPYIGGSVLFDKVLSPTGRYHGRLMEMVLLMIGTQALSVLFGILYGRINAGLTAQVIYDLKTEVFAALQRLSLRFYGNKQTGSLITGVNDNAMQLQYFFHDGLPYLLVNAVSLGGILVVMFMMDWKLALCVAVPVPAAVLFVKKLFPKLWGLYSRRFRALSMMQAVLSDNLSGIRVVKAFGKEHNEIGKFTDASNRVRAVDIGLGKVGAVTFPLTTFVMGLGGLIVWTIGSLRIVSGAITLGTLITFSGYIGMIYGRLEFLTHVVDWWSSCMNAAHRIFEILDAVPEIEVDPAALRMKIRGDVRLEHVHFGYQPLTEVLSDVSLDVKAGEMIGLVGHSGAGKSTLINIITRLYDVTEGAVYIDAVPLRRISFLDLRSQIGIVLQETFLFTGTIAENIAFARPDADRREIIDAARAAHAHQFITALSDGYDTRLGTHGLTLSGGEKQRISIARAILHDPRILILDEATGSVDTETEQQIQDALARLTRGRTTFVIAHRLSTLRQANRLIVMEKGRIAEAGTHEELFASEGIYYSMLMKQRDSLKIQGTV